MSEVARQELTDFKARRVQQFRKNLVSYHSIDVQRLLPALSQLGLEITASQWKMFGQN